MKKRAGLLWLLCVCFLLCVGCGKTETIPETEPSDETEEPLLSEDEEPAPPEEQDSQESAPEERTVVYSGDSITITVPSEYAELVRVDSIGSDNLYGVEANLYYVPDYTDAGMDTPQSCGGWMLTVERMDPYTAAHTDGAGALCRAYDGTYVYLEERSGGENAADQETFLAVLASVEIDYGDLEPFTEEDLEAFW